MAAIDIGTVLSKLDDTFNEVTHTVNSYHLRFITSDGRLRTIHCRKNVKSPAQQLAGDAQPRGRMMFNLKRNGTMLLHDLDIDSPRTVKPSMLSHYFHDNQWLPIRH